MVVLARAMCQTAEESKVLYRILTLETEMGGESKMKVILETRDGKKKSFVAPLTREEEKELFKAIDENKDAIAAYNTLAAIIEMLRNWKK